MVNLFPQALKQLTLIFFMQKVSSPNMVLRQPPNLIIGESTEAGACGLTCTLHLLLVKFLFPFACMSNEMVKSDFFLFFMIQFMYCERHD